MSEHASHLDGAAFLKDENRGLYEPSPRFKNLTKVCDFSSKNNAAVAAAVPYFQDWREAAHQIKKYSIANLDKLLVQFEVQHEGPRRRGPFRPGCRRSQPPRAGNRPASTTSRAW